MFELVVTALVHGSGYERRATAQCSDRTIRQRLHPWALWEDLAVLETDESFRSGAERLCECCGQPSQRTWCMVNRDGRPYAVFFAACYHHGGVRESWIDVVFGTWGQGTDYDDHVTFGCRFGPGAGSDLPGATAVDAAAVAPDGPLYGHKLTRSEAMSHPRIGEFWEMVDFVVGTDPLVRQHHYGHAAPTVG